MTQQEVMELMQRYLDKDLTDKENEQLMEYLETDPESREIFDRMKRLSEDLANLPKVSPPFSIVDSILPELNRIESERLVPEEKSASDGWLLKTKRFLSTYRMAGAAAAAGVVLVAVLLNGGLDGMLPASNKQSASDTAMNQEISILTAESANSGAMPAAEDAAPPDEMIARSFTSSKESEMGNDLVDLDEPTVFSMGATSMESPDGNYIAEVFAYGEVPQLIVTDHNGNELTALRFAENSQVNLLNWSEDSSVLYYEVITSEQTEQAELHIEMYLPEQPN